MKNIKNEIKKDKEKEEYINNKKIFKDNENNPKEAWNNAKKLLYGSNNQFIDRIMEENKMKTGSKNVANVLNRYYISKVRKIREKMTNITEDPMIRYRKLVKSPINKLKIKEINMSELRKIYKKTQ